MGTRRDFLKGVLAGSAAATAALAVTPAQARETRPRPPEALGFRLVREPGFVERVTSGAVSANAAASATPDARRIRSMPLTMLPH